MVKGTDGHMPSMLMARCTREAGIGIAMLGYRHQNAPQDLSVSEVAP